MLKVLKFSGVSLALLWTSFHSCSAMSGFEEAKSHPLVKKALQQEEEFRNATAKDIQTTLDIIKDTCANNHTIDSEDLKATVLTRMKTDLDLLAILDQNLDGLNEGTEVTFPLKFHKMVKALKGAIPLIQSNFESFLEGNVPKGYAYQSSQITQLGDNPDNIFGNHKGTYLKTALFNICFQLAPHTKTLDFNKMRLDWAETSPSYHLTPLPQKKGYSHFIEVDKRFAESPYFLNGDDLFKSGYFFFAHSGYAYGGDRINPHFPKNIFPQGKLYGPEDCSSWIAKLIGSPDAFTTEDQLYSYRSDLPEVEAYIKPDWPNKTIAKYLHSHTIPSQGKIQVGQIYAARKFSTDDHTMTQTRGSSYHTGLVLGVKDNNPIVLSYGRSLPLEDYEGFGVKIFSSQTTFPMKVMFFDVK